MRCQRSFVLGLFLLSSWGTVAQVPDIPPAAGLCTEIPEPARWFSAGSPDQGRMEPLISAHRGGTHLAPENTLWAYQYALAYEVALLEVDVRQTVDGYFVAFHDDTLDAKTDGSGRLEDLTLAEVQALNAADYPPWKDGAYDPAQIATLEEVLDLADAHGHGIEFDMKFALANLPAPDFVGFAQLVNAYPALLRRSIINLPPPVSLLVGALIPEGRFIYNLLDNEPAPMLYPLTEVASVFGSRLSKFDAEAAAAIHDGCALLMPHSYDAGADDEGEEILRARALGADGVQTNQPDLARALLVGPVPTVLVAEGGLLCLRNANNGLGLPQKILQGAQGGALTGVGGCVALDELGAWADFGGDASAAPTSWAQTQRRSDAVAGGALGASLLWGLGLFGLRRIGRARS